MVDVTQAMEGSYLTCDIVRDSPTKTVVIRSAGEYVEATYETKKYEKFQLEVEIDFKKKTWSPNKDSLKNIAAAFGRDSSRWVGKLVQVSVGKIGGKDGIMGFPVPEPRITQESIAQ